MRLMPLWSYLLAHMSTSFPGRRLWRPALNSEDANGSGQNTKESTVRLPDQTSLCRQYRSTGQPERKCQNVCTPRLPTPDFAIRRTYGNAGSGSTKVERGVSCCRAPLQFMRGPMPASVKRISDMIRCLGAERLEIMGRRCRFRSQKP